MEKRTYRNRIRVILAEKQLSNRWLAGKMNVTDMTISRWTTNKIQPSMNQFIELSKILEVSLDSLLEPYND